MSLVVSDTSPLTNLAAIGRLDLLHRLFGRIQIAEAVWLELNAGGGPGQGETKSPMPTGSFAMGRPTWPC